MRDLDWSDVVRDGENAATEPELTWRDNPWLSDHRSKELAHVGGEYTREMAMTLVDGEFIDRGGERHGTCRGCGQETWWKPLVGGYVCPRCGKTATTATQAQWEMTLEGLCDDACLRNAATVMRRAFGAE